MALWGDGPRFEDAEDAKRAVEELVKERDELKHTKEALECLIKNQKSVLDELEVQVDAAQRRASSAADQAKIKMEDVRAQDAELATAKSRLQAVLGMFALENDFRRLSQQVGRIRESTFPTPLVMAGPAAAGKASLISRLFGDFPDSFGIPISHTSREPQADEQRGVHYIFVSRGEMEQAMAGGAFVEVAEVDGDLYGTSLQAVSKEQQAGKVCVLHIDLAGVEQLRQCRELQTVTVWIEPPSTEALRERLVARGVADEAEIEDRLDQAQRDMAGAAENPSLFDSTIINDDLSLAYQALLQTLHQAYPHLRPLMPPVGARGPEGGVSGLEGKRDGDAGPGVDGPLR